MARSRASFARIALVATIVTGLFSTASAPAGATTLTPRAKMLRATNISRVNHSLRRVDIHYTMSKLAHKHSVAMANKGYIFHTSKPASFYLKGVSWRTWGENVGVGGPGTTVGDLQEAFMHSPGHRANILNRGFRRVAVGAYRDDDGFLWVTVFFYG